MLKNLSLLEFAGEGILRFFLGGGPPLNGPGQNIDFSSTLPQCVHVYRLCINDEYPLLMLMTFLVCCSAFAIDCVDFCFDSAFDKTFSAAVKSIYL